MIPVKRISEENTLELMVQAPYTLFAYWQLSCRYINIFRKTLGIGSSIKLTACLYKINSHHKEVFLQLDNVKRKGCCYFQELEEGYDYQVSLGFYWKKKFIVFLQSEALGIPAGCALLNKKRAYMPQEKEDINPEEYNFS